MFQFLLAILLFAGSQQDQVTISSTGPQQKDGNLLRATGDVIVTYQDIRVEADTITYDEMTKELTAGEHVIFTRGEERLQADNVSLNVDTKAGVLTNASGAIGPGFMITAGEVVRSAEGRYELKNATITTCESDQPGWTLALARAVIEPNKQVTARNSVFRLENVPLFYMPYVILPSSDRSRSTGFLIPSTSTSTTKGRSLRETFFYAINRSMDATFTGEYFSKRGLAGSVDFRAVPNRESNISVNTFFAHDRKGQGGQSARILTAGNIGQGFRAVADMNLVSSFVFRQVFEEGFNIISSPIEHSLGFLTRNRPEASLNVLYNRTGVFFTDQPTVVLRKFPTLEVSVPDRPLGGWPVYFNIDSGLTGIARRDAVIKTPTFVERFDFHPAVELPVVRSDALDWSHRFSVRETAYSHSRDAQVLGDNLNRLSYEYSSSFSGPQIQRDFGRMRHVVEPTIDYRYITRADRFRRTIVVDDVDLITNTNEVEYGITNRFFTTHEAFVWRVSQRYYFDPTFGGAIIPGTRNVFAPLLDVSGFAFADGRRRFSPVVSTMRISTNAGVSTDVQVDYDTRDHLFRSAGIIGGISRGQAFGSGSYFFTRRSPIQIPNNQLRGTLGFGNQLRAGISGAFSFSYDVARSLFQSSVAQVGYNTDCYGLSFELSQFDIGARKESRFRFAFTLKNIGSYGTLRPQERLF
jgi:LPS-assembly protein